MMTGILEVILADLVSKLVGGSWEVQKTTEDIGNGVVLSLRKDGSNIVAAFSVTGGDWTACLSPTKYSGARSIEELAVACFSSSYAIFVDNNKASNTTNGKIVRLNLNGLTLSSDVQYDSLNDIGGYAYIEKINNTHALVSWLYNNISGGKVKLVVADNGNPPSLGTSLDLVDSYSGPEIQKTIVLSESRAITMMSRKKELYNIGISGSTLTDVAQVNMLTETLGVPLTDICRIDDTTALLIAAQGALTAVQYPTGTVTCSGANCELGVGTPDDVGSTWSAGGGWHQVEFSEKGITSTTAISSRWKTISGGNGTLYLDAKIDGVWTRIRTSSNQGSSVWKWEGGGGLSAYNGRTLSGIRFGFSSGGSRGVDSHQISNFYDPNPAHSAWIIHTTGSTITYGAQAYLPNVINCKSVIRAGESKAVIAYNDYVSGDTGTGLKVMVLTITGDNVTENTDVLLRNDNVTSAKLVDIDLGEFAILYQIASTVFFRTFSISGNNITDDDNELIVATNYSLGKNPSYFKSGFFGKNVIVPLLGAANDGYYCIVEK